MSLPYHPSPHPSLPPTRLLIHPLREQYRGEPMTVITITIYIYTISVFEKGNICRSRSDTCMDHIMNAWATCYKTRTTALYCMCGGVYRFTSLWNAEGPSMYTSAYAANTGGICQTHAFEPRLITMVTGLLASAYWPMLLWWPVIDSPPVGSHWLFASGWCIIMCGMLQ